MAKNKKQQIASDAPAMTPEQRAQAKRDRFLQLAPKRVTNLLKRMGHVANMANTSNYAYTPEEVEKILTAVYGAYSALEDAFKQTDKAKPTFTL